ncbi:MAG TPA: hypothetical protein VFY35_01460 [Burkholderiaceae bacterium]|nr:hypothetical protein [Burkholderiaceae bacterium]
MTMVISMASRRAMPPTLTAHAVRQPTHSPQPADLVHLHMQAVNALGHALRQLTGPDCSPSGWATATAKAHRGLSALKQGCTLLQQGGEG